MSINMSNNKFVQHTPIEARQPVLKVMGLGGGGSNAINRMIELGLSGVEYIAANTDVQALQRSLAPTKIRLGPDLTRGLGAGGNPNIGYSAAEESYRDIAEALMGADMVFLTAGMGGGTGTGSISIAARIARSLGAVTVAIVTTPFSFEMGRRQQNAREGLAKLRPFTDTLITVPNDRLLHVAPRDLPLELAFRLADDVLRQGIQGISELITQPGLINVDFAHVRQIMQMGGGSLMSIGIGEGENKAVKAVERALHHPLLEAASVENATGIIANFTGGSDLTFIEVTQALEYLHQQTNNQADIIPGVITDERMQNRAQLILIITGLGATPVDSELVSSRTTVEEAVPVQASEPVLPTGQAQNIPAYARRAQVTPAPVRAINNGYPGSLPPSAGASPNAAPMAFSGAATPQPRRMYEPANPAYPQSGYTSGPTLPERQVERPSRIIEAPSLNPSSGPVNLDIPAFLRRRMR